MPSCPFCEKVGLPILPVRYAIARQGGAADAPKLSSPFEQSITLPEKNAHYTLRLLREGYLYVYDEGIDYWSAYVVSSQGNLFEFDIQAKSPPDIGDKHPCSRGSDPYKARCITVPDVQSATKLWLGFSDTAWTQAVLDKHQSADYRQAHMTCIDVAQWMASGANQNHMASMDLLAERVAEFAPGTQGGDTARTNLAKLKADDTLPQAVKSQKMTQNLANIPFSFADDDFQQLGDHAQALADWAQQQGEETAEIAQLAGMDDIAFGTPAIVGLEDPIGISVDLNALIMQLLDEWQELDDDKRLWKQVTSKSIGALEQAVKAQSIEHRRQEYRYEFLMTHTSEQTPKGVGTTPYKRQAEQAAERFAQMHARESGDSKDAKQRLAQYKKQYNDLYAPEGGFVARDNVDARAEQYVYRKIKEDGGAEHIQNTAWQDYTDQDAESALYDEQQRQSDDTSFQNALTAYDEAHITPISTAWLDWAKSDVFKAKFTHNHDPGDINSGMSFVTLVTHAVRNATGRADVQTFLARELAGDPKQRNNIWVRALALDQHTLAERIGARQVDLRRPDSFATEGANFMGGVAALLAPEGRAQAKNQLESTQQWLANQADRLVPVQNRTALYMREVGGSLLEAIGSIPSDLALGAVQGRLLTAMAGVGYDPSVTRYLLAQQATLTEAQKMGFLSEVLHQVTQGANSPAPSQIRGVVHNARVAARGEDNAPPHSVRGVALATQDQIDSLDLASKSDTQPGPANASEWDVPPKAHGTVEPEVFSKSQTASAALVPVDSPAFHVGVIGMLFSTWSFATMAQEESTSRSLKAQGHFVVAAVTLAGGYMEITGTALQKTEWGGAKLSKALDNRFIKATTKAERLAGFGRIVGAAGGLVLGVGQLIGGVLEYNKNRSLAQFDIATGAMAAFLSGLILFGAIGGVGFVLLIALAIVAFIWHFFVNDKYQNWLSRSYYGLGPNKFESLADQQTAFQRITNDSRQDNTSEAEKEEVAKAHLYRGYRQIPSAS